MARLTPETGLVAGVPRLRLQGVSFVSADERESRLPAFNFASNIVSDSKSGGVPVWTLSRDQPWHKLASLVYISERDRFMPILAWLNLRLKEEEEAACFNGGA